jgi:hypothetical protein
LAADLKTLALFAAHASPQPLGTTESTSPQGDRAVPALPGSSNARTGAEPANSGLTLVNSGSDLIFAAANPGDGQVPRNAISRRPTGPAEAGLLNEAFEFDSATLEGPVRDFLARLNDVGTVLGVSPTSVSLYYWLLSAGAAGAAWALVRRRRNTRGYDPADANFDDPAFPWEPDEDGNSGETLS